MLSDNSVLTPAESAFIAVAETTFELSSSIDASLRQPRQSWESSLPFLRREAIDRMAKHLRVLPISELSLETLDALSAALLNEIDLRTVDGILTPAALSPEELRAAPRLFFKYFVIPSVAWGIVRSGAPSPDRPSWLLAARRAIAAWSSTTVGYEVLGFVLGAGPHEFDAIPLCDEFTLFPHNQSGQWPVADPDPPWYDHPLPPRALIRGTVEIPKQGANEQWHRRLVGIATKCMTALRLRRSETFGIDRMFIVPDDRYFATGPSSEFNWRTSEFSPGYVDRSALAQITKEDAAFSFAFVKASSDGRLQSLSVPLQRFNLASSRERPDDRLIDLVIALEATLLAGNLRDQLSLRFRLRGAALLSESRDPSETHDVLQVAYDARSKIVHGGKTLAALKLDENKKPSEAPFVQAFHELARQVLTRFVDAALAGKQPKALVAELDELVLKRLDQRSKGSSTTHSAT